MRHFGVMKCHSRGYNGDPQSRFRQRDGERQIPRLPPSGIEYTIDHGNETRLLYRCGVRYCQSNFGESAPLPTIAAIFSAEFAREQTRLLSAERDVPVDDVGQEIVVPQSVIDVHLLIVDRQSTGANTSLVFLRWMSAEFPREDLQDLLADPSTFRECREGKVIRVYLTETWNRRRRL